MGMFIKVKVDPDKCPGEKECGKCMEICPVGVFTAQDNLIITDKENEDECTLCSLCLDNCLPGALEIDKLYE